MVDRVQPIVWESTSKGGSSDEPYQKEIDPNEDALETRGVFIQNDSSSDETVSVSRDASNNLIFEDGVVSGVKTLTDLLASGGGGITEAEHEDLNTLTHALAENYYAEYTYSTNKIFNIDIWQTISKIIKVRDFVYTYTGNKIATETVKQYNETGTLLKTLTYTYNYTGSKISNVTCVES